MATLTHAESRRMYSWWWDSHISPKNSKWLQENLTDMDVKVKSMIKLIEEDADSFRKRAEMYYRKRPELLKLVEEFYRAYRALAERYDHATGALRQAHRTMAEAFPDQLPLMLSDESPSGSSAFDADESQKDDFDMSFHTNNIKGKELLSEENAVTNSEEHASKSETEIEILKGTVSEVEAEKEAVLSQNQLSQERVSSLETEIYRMQEEFKKLNEEMILGLTKLKGAEERCILLEKENQSFQLELDTVKEERRKQQEELDSKQEELEKLNISVKDEISFLEESKRKLEDEVKLLVGEKRAIQQEVYSVKEDKKDLEQRHQKLKEELTAANINIESFQELVNKLQGENVELKEKCKKHEDEKTGLLEKLKYVESIKEKNGVLEDSLSIANAELNELREKVEVIAQNMEKLSDKNTLLESSLSGVNLELEVLQEKLNASEDSCRFLNDQNSVLFAEKRALETKVEVISNSLKSLEGRHTELEGKYLNLEKEKARILDQVTELQYYLKLEKEEHGTLMHSSRNQLAIFENLIQEKDKLREEELEDEYIKTLQSQIEILVLHNCLYDMKEQKQIFSDKCQKYLESSKCKEEHMSMLYHEIEDQKTSISEAQDDILRLSLEKSVILSLFVQFGAEAAESMSQKNSLEQDSKAGLEELLLLNEQIEMGKNLLVQKDWELFQANHKLQAMQDKNTELSGNIESLLIDINEAKVESKELESNNLKLLEYHTYRDNEIAGLRQANDTLNRLLENLYGEMQELKDKEVHLTQEVKSCEAEVETLLNDIQIKTVNSTILEEKMKEKLGSVDVENRNMKEEPSAYLPLVMSLSDCVQSLEGHIVSLAKHHSLGNQEPKSSSPSLQQKWNTEVGNEDHSAMETFGIFLLQNLHVKVSALEKMVKDIQGHPEQNRLQAEIREIEGLKSDGTLDLQELRTSNMLSLKIRKETSNATRGNTENLREKSQRIMKDIQLDPVSSPLQYGDWSSSHGPGVDTDERYTARSSNGTDGTVDFNNMEKPLLVSLKHKKELSTDKLKLSSKIKDSHQEWIGSISERLSSDFERLSFLQKSAKELKKTTEVSELSKGPISSKFKQFKEQVKEAEEAILQLVDMNNKLTKKTEKLSSSSSSLLSEQNDEIENASERKISERARKGSEKIGRLELEMQKLEYIWLKLKEEHDYKKAIASERKRPRVLLRDYLYGGRESPRRKRVSWCGCMRTRTKEN